MHMIGAGLHRVGVTANLIPSIRVPDAAFTFPGVLCQRVGFNRR